jgi:hypothetical protein
VPFCGIFRMQRNNSKAAEFLTNKINKFRHTILRKNSRKSRCGNLIRFQTFGATLATILFYSIVGDKAWGY